MTSLAVPRSPSPGDCLGYPGSSSLICCEFSDVKATTAKKNWLKRFETTVCLPSVLTLMLTLMFRC